MTTTDKLEVQLATYRYDALDRLSSSMAFDKAAQCFYKDERLTTELHTESKRTVFRLADQVLAEQVLNNTNNEISLLVTDGQGSVLGVLGKAQFDVFSYMPYGYQAAPGVLGNLLRFTAERPDRVTGHYLLGKGYRAFNPVLMRFNSPDRLSPFDDGGVNAYTYCGGEPINHVDPEGDVYSFTVLKAADRFLGFIGRSRKVTALAPRLTYRSPSSVKTARTAPRRVIANLHKSPPIEAVPEELIARTPSPIELRTEVDVQNFAEWEMKKYRRRYVTSAKDMLKARLKVVENETRNKSVSAVASQSYGPPDPVFGSTLDKLKYKVAQDRIRAGRESLESKLGPVRGGRRNI